MASNEDTRQDRLRRRERDKLRRQTETAEEREAGSRNPVKPVVFWDLRVSR